VARLELYGTARCPHTQEMREWLEWQRKDFVEYDVDKDITARHRLHELSGGQRSVPVLVEDDKIIRIGWEGRTCVIEAD
jgi:glutaredoxin